MGIQGNGESRVEEHDVVDESLRLSSSQGRDNAALALPEESDALGVGVG